MIPIDRRTIVACCLFLPSLLAACGERRHDEYRLSGQTMGTDFSVAVVNSSDIDRERIQSKILGTLEKIDRQMSTYRPDSELTVFNNTLATDWIPTSLGLCRAVEDALRFSEISGGAFDVTVGPLVDLWGFGPAGSRTEPPADESIDQLRSATGWKKLHADCTRPAVRKDHVRLHIDLSAYAKGLAVDEIATVLDKIGIANYLVEIGGELRANGHNAANGKWRIAIESPDEGGRKIEKIIRIRDLAVATSGDYRNFFEHDGRRYSHTIDPRTARPVAHGLASVTVLADSAAYADAMATALIVLGPDAGPDLARQLNIPAYFLLRENDDVEELTTMQFDKLTKR